jgi:hypothetical protein
MKWSLACAAALVFMVACGGDKGEPGPGGTGSSSSSSSSSGDADASAGKKPNGTIGCEQGTECESGVCFLGNMQHFCTMNCTEASKAEACRAPLTGSCNKQGFCKRD